jgi:hypothetical protein
MGFFSLKDLQFGTLNNLTDNRSGNSGDRRRTKTTTALRLAIDKVFEKDSLAGVTDFNGIVINSREILYPVYQNRGSILEEYAIAGETSSPEDAPPETQEHKTYVYKVLIPEIEPRPVPKSYDDPIIATYSDVYSDFDQDFLIPLGALVTVKYEDSGNLFNPRIIRVIKNNLAIENISVDAQGNTLQTFKDGVTQAYFNGPTPNGDRLRNTIQGLGYVEKGAQMTSGGDITANMEKTISSILRTIREKLPAITVKITGGNDSFHHSLSYDSRHKKGNAIDITIAPATADNRSSVLEILMGYSAGNSNIRFLDEYTKQTDSATGQHFHISWGQGSEGEENLNEAKSLALSNLLAIYTV